ncbi:GntR family transcriptional regulator [Roseovarius sp. 2305UL8-3]|uniref:GntR family transcriptional regulator n=1 Tax=Roseovarius conchicola TaxID=3121636 RepID=UPI003528333B
MTVDTENLSGKRSKKTMREQASAASSEEGSMVEKAEQLIRRQIESKKLQPGEIIDFVSLAKELGTSRTPIRESIRHLHSIGLVETCNGGQFRVTILTREKIIAYYNVRLVLEVSAVEMSAEWISDPELALLQQNMEIFRDNIENYNLLPRVDTQFHEIIYDATRNRYLAKHLKSLRPVLGLLPHRTYDVVKRVREIAKEHSDILRALEAHDTQSAKAAVRTHIENSMAPLIDPD